MHPRRLLLVVSLLSPAACAGEPQSSVAPVAPTSPPPAADAGTALAPDSAAFQELVNEAEHADLRILAVMSDAGSGGLHLPPDAGGRIQPGHPGSLQDLTPTNPSSGR